MPPDFGCENAAGAAWPRSAACLPPLRIVDKKAHRHEFKPPGNR
jgi:hypothetical protein